MKYYKLFKLNIMKKFIGFYLYGLFIVAFLFCQTTVKSQSSVTNSKGAIGVTYSGLGDNSAFNFQILDGAGSYSGKGHYSFGITYMRPITKNLDIETGISYRKHNFRLSNSSLWPDAPEPNITSNSVVDIPVSVRWSFLKYFFMNGGILLGFDTSKDNNNIDNQTGIGATIGVGAKYDFNDFPIGIFINPYYKMYSLIPFTIGNYHMRTDEAAFRVGIVYYLQ